MAHFSAGLKMRQLVWGEMRLASQKGVAAQVGACSMGELAAQRRRGAGRAPSIWLTLSCAGSYVKRQQPCIDARLLIV
ncbi:MAG: hypothetical protein KAG89_10325, partial [Fulvimarina manganoxydans]|uniref:hypothetical protein n=1 Tax=Fulvimarina manganoxydans TaxID=937218 RepID=UPI002355AE70